MIIDNIEDCLSTINETLVRIADILEDIKDRLPKSDYEQALEDNDPVR